MCCAMEKVAFFGTALWLLGTHGLAEHGGPKIVPSALHRNALSETRCLLYVCSLKAHQIATGLLSFLCGTICKNVFSFRGINTF